MLKKINTYLLENYPLLYHSKLVLIALISVVLWLLSLSYGYIYFDKTINVLYSIEHLYSKSWFFELHIIIIVIILSVWLIGFYKDNPLKHYYPLQRHYYSKLLLHLFLGIVFLISAKIPFDYGVKLKYYQLFEVKTVVKDLKLLEFVEPLFIRDLKRLQIVNKSFPDPFPLDGYKKDDYDGYWYRTTQNKNVKGKISLESNLYYNPNYTDGNVLLKNYSTNNLFPNIIDEKHSQLINESNYVFFKTKQCIIEGDSCSNLEVISDFVDVSSIPKLRETSLYNYSYRVKNQFYESYKIGNYYESNSFVLNDDKLFVGQFQHLMDRAYKNEIKALLDRYVQLMNNYGINIHINTNFISEYLIDKNFEDFDFTFIQNNKRWNESVTKDYIYRDYSALEEKIKSENMFIDFQTITLLSSNLEDIESSYDFTEWFFFGIIAFYIALVLIWFEFTDLKSFLLCIPTIGVLSVVYGSFVGLFNINSDQSLILLCVYMMIIYCIGLFTIHNKNIKKIYASVSINVLYLLSIFLIFCIVSAFAENYEIWHPSDCYRRGYYDSKYSFLVNPYLCLLCSICSVLPFFKLVKKWKAKKN